MRRRTGGSRSPGRAANNENHPLTVYRYFRDELSASHLQFIPIVERVERKDLPLAEQGRRTTDGSRLLFRRSKRTSLTSQCQRCPARWACHGGCPKDRFTTTADGEPGLNYLCAGYYTFFSHAQPAIVQMGQYLQTGHPAADIMGTDRG